MLQLPAWTSPFTAPCSPRMLRLPAWTLADRGRDGFMRTVSCRPKSKPGLKTRPRGWLKVKRASCVSEVCSLTMVSPSWRGVCGPSATAPVTPGSSKFSGLPKRLTTLTCLTALRALPVPAAQGPGWIAAISSLGWVLALPLAPFWGVLADRYSRKLIIVRSAAIEAVIFAGWALSTAPLMALAFRCLNGFILGNTGVMLAVQASATPRQRLALAVGIVGAGSPAGRAVGPILGALLVHLIDVRGMLLFDAALSVLTALLLTVVMRESEHVRPKDVRVLSLLRGAISEIMSRPIVLRLFLATAAAQVGLWTMLPYVPVFIARLSPVDAVTAVGVVLSIVGLGEAI